MTDSEIISLFFSRDETAIKQTDEKYGGLAGSVAYNVLGDTGEAGEIKNDTLLVLWNNIPPERPDPLCAYISKIARNLSLKRLRSRLADKRGGGEYALCYDELCEAADQSADAEAALDKKELAQRLNAFAASLKERDRQLFVLRYFYFMSLCEISKRTGFSQGKIKTSLYRIRKSLRNTLESEGYL